MTGSHFASKAGKSSKAGARSASHAGPSANSTDSTMIFTQATGWRISRSFCFERGEAQRPQVAGTSTGENVRNWRDLAAQPANLFDCGTGLLFVESAHGVREQHHLFTAL